jgi:hypothetical protein
MLVTAKLHWGDPMTADGFEERAPLRPPQTSRAVAIGGLCLLIVVAPVTHVINRFQLSIFAALLGLLFFVGGSFALGFRGHPCRSRRLAVLARLTALLLALGSSYAALALLQDVYINAAPNVLLISLFSGVILLLLGLSFFVHRSDSAYYACLALLLLVALIASYSVFAVIELLFELPELWAEHFLEPKAVHFFNVTMAGYLIALALSISAGVVGITAASAIGKGPMSCRLSRMAVWAFVCVSSSLMTMGQAPNPNILKAKYGWDALSKEREKELWEDVDTFALFEAFLITCGKPSQIEERIRKAVSPCVQPSALKKVADKFREKLAEQLAKDKHHKCETKGMRDLIKPMTILIDKQVDRATQACKSCLWC